jgi:hypothetical protein
MQLYNLSRPKALDGKIRLYNEINPVGAYSLTQGIKRMSGGDRESRLKLRASQASQLNHLGSKYNTHQRINCSVDSKFSYSLNGMPRKRSESNINSKRYHFNKENNGDYSPNLLSKDRLKSKRQLSQTKINQRSSRENSHMLTPAVGEFKNKSFDIGPSTVKRPLPILEKDNVFNEWAAVIKHQDEIDQEMKRLQTLKRRERQLKYKQDLDNQHNEFIKRKKGALSQEMAREEEIRNLQVKRLKERDTKNDRIQKKKMEDMKKDSINSILEQREK